MKRVQSKEVCEKGSEQGSLKWAHNNGELDLAEAIKMKYKTVEQTLKVETCVVKRWGHH